MRLHAPAQAACCKRGFVCGTGFWSTASGSGRRHAQEGTRRAPERPRPPEHVACLGSVITERVRVLVGVGLGRGNARSGDVEVEHAGLLGAARQRREEAPLPGPPLARRHRGTAAGGRDGTEAVALAGCGVEVFALLAFALIRALHPRLEALAVLLEAVALLAPAAARVHRPADLLDLVDDLRCKGVLVAELDGVHRLRALRLVVTVVGAVHALAPVAHQARRKALAVQL
mmetsp:Transcript_29150/g.59241  ORF Transcript_29150/g.59241 Transcript_29150/m.59241 type:complete len:230 (+) Transcript_29150:217-906(+)